MSEPSQALSPNTFDQRLARLEALLQEEPEPPGESDEEGSPGGQDSGEEAAGAAADGFGRSGAPQGAAAEQDWLTAAAAKKEDEYAAIEGAAAAGTGATAGGGGAGAKPLASPGPRTPGPGAAAGAGTGWEDQTPMSSSTPGSDSDSLDPLSATRRWRPPGPAGGGEDRDDAVLTPFSELDDPAGGAAPDAGLGSGYGDAPARHWEESARGFGAALAEVGMFDASERGDEEGEAAAWTQGPHSQSPRPADSGRFSQRAEEAAGTSRGRSAGKGTEGGDGPWERVNSLLTAHAFSPLPARAIAGETASEREARLASAVASAVEQVTDRLRARDELVRALSSHRPSPGHDSSRARREVAEATAARKEAEQLRRERDALSRRAQHAEEEVARRRAEDSAPDGALSRAKQRAATLQQQLRQSEHVARRREEAAAKLQEKLATVARRDEEARRREDSLLRSLDAGRGPRLGAAAREVVRALDHRRRTMEEEMHFLREENKRLAGSLRDRENVALIRGRVAGAEGAASGRGPSLHSSGGSPTALLRRLQASVSEARAQTASALQREQEAARRVLAAEQVAGTAKEELARAREEADNLRETLRSRPHPRQWQEAQERVRTLKDRCEELEKEVKLRRRASGQPREARPAQRMPASATAPGEGGEEVGEEEDGEGRWRRDRGARRAANSRAMMRQDRTDHTLNLSAMQELPEATVRNLLRDTCRALGVSHPTRLPEASQALGSVVRTVPALHAFVQRIASAVESVSPAPAADKGGNGLPGALPTAAAARMSHAAQCVERWAREQPAAQALSRFRAGVAALVAARAVASPEHSPARAGDASDKSLLTAVATMVEVERRVASSEQAYAAADATIKDKPEAFLSRVVAYFQHLFGVRSAEGLFPMINEVYVTVGEQRNVLQAIAQTLGLGESAPAHAVHSAVVDLQRRASTANEGQRAEDSEGKATA